MASTSDGDASSGGNDLGAPAAAGVDLTLVLDPFRSTITSDCPGGPCAWMQKRGEVLIGVVGVIAFLFLLTLFPPVFSWSRWKADGKRRVIFAFVACVTFYFWLAFLIFNSAYCFGFWAADGPCKSVNRSELAILVERGAAVPSSSAAEPADGGQTAAVKSPPLPSTTVVGVNESECETATAPALTPHEEDLRLITAAHVLIVILLLVVLVANINEGKTNRREKFLRKRGTREWKWEWGRSYAVDCNLGRRSTPRQRSRQPHYARVGGPPITRMATTTATMGERGKRQLSPLFRGGFRGDLPRRHRPGPAHPTIRPALSRR